MTMASAITSKSDQPEVVTRSQWLLARKDFLSKEKQLTHLRDELARCRRELPWEKVEKPYTFEGASGRVSLADLFNGKSQLVIYHFMLGPEWEAGCPSCSLAADGFDASIPHFEQRDSSFVAVSRAPYAKLAEFKKRMGWKFNWVSSYGTDFNFDFGVSFTPEQLASGKNTYNYGTMAFRQEEAPGLSAFAKQAGEVYHTYSTYGRGLEPLLSVYNLLDYSPIGRGEEGLTFPMAWVRHHDKYESKPAAHTCCEHNS
jgi:predicted dithiol-disulfide oxidoreductase (DUF899 family)